MTPPRRRRSLSALPALTGALLEMLMNVADLHLAELALDADDETLAEAAAPPDAAAAALRHSGLYRRRPSKALPPLAPRDELRLDVDGHFPQQVASGVLREGLANRLEWVARLTSVGPARWTGRIVFREATPGMPAYGQVEIAVAHGAGGKPTSLTLQMSGGATVPRSFVYGFVSRAFDPVEFEFDSTTDANPALAINTHDHPNRPPALAAESLSIADVYRRAGFNVRVAPAGPAIPLTGAGTDGVWSDTEMHDAMQAHWSRFADLPQWAMWVFHAAMHEEGPSLGGIMFDDIGPHERQGTAVFTESFITEAPAGDTAAAAWVARMRFWTACHEMGHAFNLAHAWQKSLGTPWMPLANEPEARSFMNYPFRVAGGQAAFFSDFEFRFSDAELLFMRHAPRRLVQMGHAAWFDHHGFEQASVSPEPALQLVLRMNRAQPLLQFMEPAMLELKLTNGSKQPMLVPTDLLEGHELTLVIKRGDQPARLWRPFATACHALQQRVLAPGESMYAPLFAGAGRGGWLVAEPGRYRLQACLHLADGEDVVSAPLDLRVAAPAGYDEEMLAQDFFSTDVGRVLSFDGSRELASANDTLREAVARCPDRAVSTHARVALGLPMRRAGKVLRGARGKPKIDTVAARPDDARHLLGEALLQQQDSAAATLGHVEYRGYVETYAGWLAQEGEVKPAKAAMNKACSTLEKRQVRADVLAEMHAFGDALGAGGAKKSARGK